MSSQANAIRSASFLGSAVVGTDLPYSITVGCDSRKSSTNCSFALPGGVGVTSNGGRPLRVSRTTLVVNKELMEVSFKGMPTVTRVVAIPTNRIDATGVIVFALQFRHTSVNAAIKRAKDASAIIHARNVPMRILIVGYPDTSKIRLNLRREKF